MTAARAHDDPPLLLAEGISKRFGPTRALHEVDVRLHTGRCLGLVGRNGAGKSTLVAILSGLLVPDAGRILFDGRPAPRTSDIPAWRARIATVFQHSMVIPALTVTENVFLGDPRVRAGLIDWSTMRRRTTQIMEEWGFEIDPDAHCEDLSVDQRQVVEIARALATGSRCLLLDEPTAALERSAITILFERVRALVQRGVAVLYISHHLEEVFEICDEITVLRDGAVVRNAPTVELTKEDLVTAMVGEALPVSARASLEGGGPALPTTLKQARLTVRDLRRASPQGALRGVSLTVGEGERVGVTGLLSAGVGTLGRVVAGMEPADGGEVLADDRAVRTGNRRAALRAGIGYVPADRAAEGFVGLLGVAENETMTTVDRLIGAAGLIRPRARREAAAPISKTLSVIASGPDQPVQELSGGNQQKVTVGRALIHDPRVVVAVTPTRGVDVAAKSLLLEALGEAARAAGAALLLASDELDDVMECDRVLVLVRGEVFGEFTPPYDREQLIAASEGLEPSSAAVQGNEGADD